VNDVSVADNRAYVATGKWGLEVFELGSFASPPWISLQPLDSSRTVGQTVTFKVSAIGDSPLSFQWRKSGVNLVNGGNLSGVTSTNLMLTNIQMSDAGNYSVVITNFYGSVTSRVATLIVEPSLLLIVSTNSSYGITNGIFGFTLSGPPGQTVVTEATTNLANPVWLPIQTNELDGSPVSFSDPQWTNYPGRFYRLRLQ
jgi:hypothetical protein